MSVSVQYFRNLWGKFGFVLASKAASNGGLLPEAAHEREHRSARAAEHFWPTSRHPSHTVHGNELLGRSGEDHSWVLLKL